MIEVNELIEKLTKSIQLLNNAIDILNNQSVSELSANLPEILKWKLEVQTQHEFVTYALNDIIGLAITQSSEVLLKLNQSLVGDSKELLSYVNTKLAQHTMQPYFIKAQSEYKNHQLLIENISLASSSSKRDKHADWFADWKNLENDILSFVGKFSDYPINEKKRADLLVSFIKNHKLNHDSFLNFQDTIKRAPPELTKLDSLLKKLAKDKAILF